MLEGPIINKINTSELQYNVRRTAEEKKKLLKKKNIYCNPNWPFCLYQASLFDVREVLILKESKPPYIIEDYYYVKNQEYHDENIDYIDGDIPLDKTRNVEILIERRKHVCDDQKIVDISQNFQDKNIQNEMGDLNMDKKRKRNEVNEDEPSLIKYIINKEEMFKLIKSDSSDSSENLKKKKENKS